ncbi:MAG: hypothetical protein ABI035_08130 [Gemmatimonadaceae bacterium]
MPLTSLGRVRNQLLLALIVGLVTAVPDINGQATSSPASQLLISNPARLGTGHFSNILTWGTKLAALHSDFSGVELYTLGGAKLPMLSNPGGEAAAPLYASLFVRGPKLFAVDIRGGRIVVATSIRDETNLNSISIPAGVTGGCLLASGAAFYSPDAAGSISVVNLDGHGQKSFRLRAPGAFARVAELYAAVVAPVLGCIPAIDVVIVLREDAPVIDAYTSSGKLLWHVNRPWFRPLSAVLKGAAIARVPPKDGFDSTIAAFAFGANELLIQTVFNPTGRQEKGKPMQYTTMIIDGRDGAVVFHSNAVPRIVGAQGAKTFVEHGIRHDAVSLRPGVLP